MTEATAELRPLQVEANGINVIAENERKGHPRDLFWPWFAANISVLGLSYGSFELGFGISFWQAIVVGLVGIVLSFLACGFIAVAGKRGSAPTMVLSRAAFGVNGNKLPTVISWLLTVGWETVLVILATLATATVFHRLGVGGGTGTKVIALIIVVALTIFGGVMGFDLIMRMQTWITIVTGVFTVVFIALVADHIHWHAVSAIKGGSLQDLIGALVFMMTGFGLGWVNCAADYSRYLPRRSSGAGVIGWTTFASSVAPIFLLVFGLLLAGSSTSLNSAIGADPIGALTSLLPTWFLVPFAIVAVLGLIGGSVLDIYSSGLAMLTLGIRIRAQLRGPVRGVPDHARRADRGLVRRHAGRHRAAAAGLRRARPVHHVRPLRRHQMDPGAGCRGVDRDRLGPGHQQLGELAELAGLPAPPVRARRQGRRLGLRQPRRAHRAGHRLRRDRAVQPFRGPGRGSSAHPGSRHRLELEQIGVICQAWA
jgi:NCS1 family nucleobase:cation symporter-1